MSAIVWLTGLSGSGKSTLAAALATRLAPRPVEILDGDEVRTWLTEGLGYSREDRDTNVRRIGRVARLLASHGVIVLVAVISPYAATRDEVRAQSEHRGIPFIEVFVNVPLDLLVARDVKGLYKRAIAGEIASFTGISDPYEAPVRPVVEVHPDRDTVDESVQTIATELDRRLRH